MARRTLPPALKKFQKTKAEMARMGKGAAKKTAAAKKSKKS